MCCAPGKDEAVAPTAQCVPHVIDDRLVACVVGDHRVVDLGRASGCGGIGCAVVPERGQVQLALGVREQGCRGLQGAGVRVGVVSRSAEPELRPGPLDAVVVGAGREVVALVDDHLAVAAGHGLDVVASSESGQHRDVDLAGELRAPTSTSVDTARPARSRTSSRSCPPGWCDEDAAVMGEHGVDGPDLGDQGPQGAGEY